MSTLRPIGVAQPVFIAMAWGYPVTIGGRGGGLMALQSQYSLDDNGKPPARRPGPGCQAEPTWTADKAIPCKACSAGCTFKQAHTLEWFTDVIRKLQGLVRSGGLRVRAKRL